MNCVHIEGSDPNVFTMPLRKGFPGPDRGAFVFTAWPPQFNEGCLGAAENTNTGSHVHRKPAGVTLNPVFEPSK